ALACIGGTPDQVVGTVRIHEDAPGRWCGSRLAVHPAFRRHGRLGATLIRLAVSSANARGCQAFLAHVQSQNVPLFKRLHWQALAEETLRGRPHHLMQADLASYPPCADPWSGFVVPARGGR
ncbi:MAG: GNAT family N-acetyltransferase, partial [Zoogloeaceae bacterium]|nr:GNAT family N-acetyltransferase [Zoogloeaceae bacterium]